jgi:AcrR family transcriptional regulator
VSFGGAAGRRLPLMGSASATTNTRLSVDDWIQAGFAILAEEGIKALKIDRLCRRLSVTKGSFYWHFTDIAGYRAALVQAWGELRDDDRRHFGELAELPPRERLSEMMSSLVSARHWTLERAMREWARTDDAAAASVRVADQRVLAAVRRAFLNYGFDADDADLRANATFAAAIGFVHLAGPHPGPRATADREGFLNIMLKP